MHKLLLDKLKLYGITGQALSWFESYLVLRAQCTFLLGKKSDVLKSKSGVPQGSILGPLLFTLFMNDLPSVIEHGKVIMYADDTALMYSSSNPREIETCLNHDWDCVRKWLERNQLTLNTDKTCFMIFGTPQKLLNLQYTQIAIKVYNVPIKQVQSVKYLGVCLDQHMTWQDHVKYTSNKIASRLALLRRVRKYLTIDSAKLLANSLILPYYDYCSVSWSTCNKRTKDILIKQHKQMARIVLKINTLIPTSEMFSTLRWIDMEKRWEFNKSKLMYDVMNNSAPSYLYDMFTLSANTHRYSTRSADNLGVIIPRIKTECGKRAFSVDGDLQWNSLPHSVRNAPTKNNFCSLYFKQRS